MRTNNKQKNSLKKRIQHQKDKNNLLKGIKQQKKEKIIVFLENGGNRKKTTKIK